ncbi:hypothetical protein AB833_23950 [Chromatiales bacterium (ex Bugula neritina AB1)]|nr:hypothetical protein AB833_23950 [Chromatiales bacterium (ex Bugula neritina AB1)]
MRKLLLATAIAGALSVAPAFADFDLENEQDKLSYSLGMMLGANITQRFGDLNFDALIEGLSKQHQNLETEVTIQEAQTLLSAFEQKAAAEQQEKAAARAKVAAAEGAAYLAENKAREGVSVTDSGLQYEVLQEADGAKPALTDTVSVHYVGTLLDGTEFDSSIARGQPAEFGLQGVIKGWTEGLQLMNTGSKFRFVIPSELAYGERGAGGQIGPGETLIFEVELLEIK